MKTRFTTMDIRAVIAEINAKYVICVIASSQVAKLTIAHLDVAANADEPFIYFCFIHSQLYWHESKQRLRHRQQDVSYPTAKVRTDSSRKTCFQKFQSCFM